MEGRSEQPKKISLDVMDDSLAQDHLSCMWQKAGRNARGGKAESFM